MSHTSLSTLILVSALLAFSVQPLDTCTNTAATLYDGFLDTYIYSASFQRSQNSYFKFTNPYLTISPVNATTVTFWAKIPSISANGTLNTGRFLDCQDIISLRLVNDSVQFQIGIGNNALNTSLSLSVFSNSFSSLQTWNSYTFTYSVGSMAMYLNGVLVGS